MPGFGGLLNGCGEYPMLVEHEDGTSWFVSSPSEGIRVSSRFAAAWRHEMTSTAVEDIVWWEGRP